MKRKIYERHGLGAVLGPLTARWSRNLSSRVDVEKSSLGSRAYVKDLALHLLHMSPLAMAPSS